MSTQLGPRFDNRFAGTPARMSPEDLEIWRRWWPTVRDAVDEVYFDVGLGRGAPPPPLAPEPYKRMWKRNTQLRADVVMVREGKVAIAEIRYAASSNAVGRLLSYKQLYLDDPVLGRDVEMLLITNVRDENVARIAEAVGIQYIVA